MQFKRCLRLALLFSTLLFTLSIFAAEKEVALTIDDLPFVGKGGTNKAKLNRQNKRFMQILDTLKAEHVPAAGFVVPQTIEAGQWALLEDFHNAGNIIANHTYNHVNFNRTSVKNYIASIHRADEILQPLMSKPKYFRYPFLASGRNCKDYLAVRDYLHKEGYVIAPVTIDSKDFNLNATLHATPWRVRRAKLGYFRSRYLSMVNQSITRAEQKTEKKMGRPVKQIFLIHMNTLNAHFLADVIALFRKRGYQFITLPVALQDPYYKDYQQRCVNDESAKPVPASDGM